METDPAAPEEHTLPLPLRMLIRLLAHLGIGAVIAWFLAWPLIVFAVWWD
jgi:hypothetical protein